ncbi:isocitrate/isopropylmalate dehydrogenase family protein [Falsiroseomonas selenitidurans]|uniref:Isocitrate/isopropylmalate dehydrogenase family protein n=1 Tax=Falsiroseomonas selenitidurans TaxID=2716335 RepID=A0ABX1E6B9_9PROT|nr:isocitrate/isopropylmalate dehydrogenase family protein [Falsiroseomonas selenitidurans]NKC32511.1 isocitrate/isopropylmalate dehydrogenase family protein [Falsiroseomonas selenitidurans]
MPRFLVLPGDGIGPEIMAATLGVLRAVDARHGLDLSFETQAMGLETLASHGTTLPDSVMEAARASDGVLLGPISHLHYPPRDKGGINVSAAFRVGLDLFANVRPARTRAGLGRGHQPLDLVIMREATEGFYPDRNLHQGHGEFMPTPDVAMSLRRITRHASLRIARAAFDLARRRRRKVTAVHKANTFIMTDGLWLRCVREVAQDYPDVTLDEIIVDACAAILVRDPQRFDVLVATNFHADILSDLASELSGGLGLAGSTNENDVLCCAQAQHGSAPDIAGQDKANPCSMILSAAMLLEWHALHRGNTAAGQAAAAIQAAVDATLAEPATRTVDLGGPLGTKDFAARVAAAL